MKKNALIIFMKKPVPGKVKTRLAKKIGFDAATEVYKQLLNKTKEEVRYVDTDVFVFYHPEIIEFDMWNNINVHKVLQSAGDLGVKMKNAFQHVFRQGYDKAVIIGTDCYELTYAHMNQAFDQLQSNDVVFGPSNDGGYYLLGMNRFIPQLFENKPWSTPEVLHYSVMDCNRLRKRYSLLPVLIDIDEWEDLQKFPELIETSDITINL